MGAKGSTGRGNQDPSDAEPPALDYYEILEVAEDANADEIKRSFRRLALIHHPDKNHTDVEQATRRFAVLQQAYEILSDEQERAWYDSHRASLIPEPDAETVFEDIRKGANLNTRVRDRGLTVRHLARFMDINIWDNFDDGDNSFFSIYRNLFARLSSEEVMFASEQEFPSFGFSTWPWTASKHDNIETTRDFYNAWMNFATEKDFTWTEQWNITEAPDRRVRRLMEKDNKKLRDDARKEYNDTVRTLVRFIRKRDPRYKRHLDSQSQPNPSATPAVSKSADIAKQKAAQAYVEQEWQKVESKALHADLDWAAVEGDDLEEWECVACRKTFRSEAAWDSHERSKKHMKEVERLKMEMEEEDEDLELDVDVEISDSEIPLADEEPGIGDVVNISMTLSPSSPSSPGTSPRENALGTEHLPSEIQDLSLNNAEHVHVDTEEYLPRRRRKAAKRQALERDAFHKEMPEKLNGDDTPLEAGSDTEAPAPSEPSKRDKRRARQAKKAEEGATTETSLSCNVCGQLYPSKTKLFNHITETGHAMAASGDNGAHSRKEKAEKKKRR